MAVKARFPLFLKISGASFLVVTAVLGFIGLIAWRDQKMDLQEKFGLTLQHIAQTAALFVDGDAHERVHTNADARNEEFAKLRATLDRVRKENKLKEDQIYTLRPMGDGKYEFVVMLQEKTFIGDKYKPPAAQGEILKWLFANGGANHSPIYTDDNGSYVSGYAPIRDGAGKTVAVLEVDYHVDEYLAELSAQMKRRMWILPAAMLLAGLLSLLVARSITKAVARLVDGTAHVVEGHYDRKVEVSTRDELHTLADSFNIMLSGLRERFAMLKFVPKHTREVIARSVNEGGDNNGFVAQTRDVCVFFSDIRGFTTLSDRLAPDRIINMLNIYLRKEAEIIERNHGSIDKYIGDAVMAVFEGPDRFADAVRSAVEVQQAIGELNAKGAFEAPIEVGIGIAGGEVVMGSVGYEDRLEFAVIGRMVNLASRLTAVARGGEIVISELAADALAGRHALERLDGLKLKGFADAVTCFKVKTSVKEAA
jgi:class 3 adenylate cyclase